MKSMILIAGFFGLLCWFYQLPYPDERRRADIMHTPGMGYLESDRAALEAVLINMCGGAEGLDCGWMPELAPPPRKPV